MSKKSFIIYDEWANLFCGLPNEEAGELIKCICNYELGNEVICDSPTVNAIFQMIKITLDENARKYAETCEKRRESGSKGGKQKVANAKQKVANATICQAKGSKRVANSSDNEYDNDNDISNSINAITSKTKTAKYIVELFHLNCPSFPKVNRITDRRVKTINARLKDYSEDEIISVFKRAEKSDFLKNGTDKWNGADFDWIMNPNNFVKILEGKYDNRETPKRQDGMIRTTYDFEALNQFVKEN